MLGANTPSYGFYLGPTPGVRPGLAYPFRQEEEEGAATGSESESDVGDSDGSVKGNDNSQNDAGQAAITAATNNEEDESTIVVRKFWARCRPETTQEKRFFDAMIVLVFLMVVLVVVILTVCLGTDICSRTLPN